MNDKNIGRTINVLKVIICLLIVLVLACFSIYSVKEQEQAVIVTFGVPSIVATPGLHFKIPFVQEKHIVPMVTNGLSIGHGRKTGAPTEFESLMITSDYNFVNVGFFLEYRVSDPIAYRYASHEPVEILRMMALSYIRDTIGRYPIDSIITTGRNEIQTEIKEKLMERLDRENIGLQLINITIQNAAPSTAEVVEAFRAVETAKQGKETAINNANKYRSEQESAALAQADEVKKQAEVGKQARISEARGQMARFNAMYNEYEREQLIAKRQMYEEAMREILPQLKVVIEDSDSSASTMLPLEPSAGLEEESSDERDE